MKKYKIIDIIGNFGIFVDDIVESDDEYDALDKILNEIQDNLGNYIEIELEEIDENEDDKDVS